MLGNLRVLGGFSSQTRTLWNAHHVACLPDEALQSLEELGVKAVIIRPDRYILGVANTAEALDRISGLLAQA